MMPHLHCSLGLPALHCTFTLFVLPTPFSQHTSCPPHPSPRRSPRRIDWAKHRQPQDNDGDQCEHDAQHPLLARAACHPLHLQTVRHDRTVMSARVRPPGSWLDVAVIVKPADCSATSTILISSDFAAASVARSIPSGSRPMLIIDTPGAPCIAMNNPAVGPVKP